MRRFLALPCSLLVLATMHAAPSDAAPKPLTRSRWEFRGSGQIMRLHADVTVKTDDRPAMIAVTMADYGHDGKQLVYTPIAYVMDVFPNGTYRLTGSGGQHDACVPPLTSCSIRPTGRDHFEFDFAASSAFGPMHTRLYLLTEAATATLKVHKMTTYRRTPTRGPGFVRRTSADTTGQTAHANDHRAEAAVFDLTVPGGPNGSTAVALPPCDVEGAAAATLTGGEYGDYLTTCPRDPYLLDPATNRGKTTWRYTGTGAGLPSSATRLLVLDA